MKEQGYLFYIIYCSTHLFVGVVFGMNIFFYFLINMMLRLACIYLD
jgi:hypothetical protein